MKANNYISKNEHKLIVIIAFILVALAFSNLAYQIVDYYTNPDLFEIYDIKRASPLPLFNFLTLFILIALYKTKRFIISFFLTLCCFIIFVRELHRAIEIILIYNPFPELSLVEQLLIIANYFDYIVFFLVSILLFWHISILLRTYIKTLQRANELP